MVEDWGAHKAADIVVMGASRGGITALPALIHRLSPDLPVALFVVLHLPEAYAGDFSERLKSQTKWPAHFAIDGERIVAGNAYVAPPGRNMLLERHRVVVEDSPRESYHRPSINALFRSAALAYGQRVVAVILTGALEDGAAGAWEVWRRGGTVIVQDPATAECRDLPAHVLKTVPVDYCASLPHIANFVSDLAVPSGAKAERRAGTPRLVIVEDERIVAMSLERELRALGYEICAMAATREAAVEAAERTRPDAVLMDIRLAGEMNGTEAAYLIWRRLQIPVIYLTAYADADTLAEVKRTEAYGYVMKPYETPEVHAAIQIALERRERESIRLR
jgi:chemotaxis response regulator CheB